MLGVTILLLAATASDDAPAAVVRASTALSLDQFGACFARAQEAKGAAWSFVPSEHGGTFSNIGASTGGAEAYIVKFTEGRRANALRLLAASPRDGAAAAIEQCR